jgi:hypothetical protein
VHRANSHHAPWIWIDRQPHIPLSSYKKNLPHGAHHLHLDPASPLNRYRGEPVNPLPTATTMRTHDSSGRPPLQAAPSGHPPLGSSPDGLQSAVHFSGVLFFSYLMRPDPAASVRSCLVDWGHADAAHSPWHHRS